MKAIILAGGYAKRMWPLTKDTPKALLPLNDKRLIDFIMQRLEQVEAVDEIYISTNKRFAAQFEEWMRKCTPKKEIRIVVENTTCEEEKLGAVKAIDFVLKQKNVDDDCLIIAGDNLFEFDLNNLVQFSKGDPVLLVYDLKDKEKASKCGVVSVDTDGKITDFEEKPTDPKSTLVSTACYFFPKETLNFFNEYLSDGNHPDAVGYFIQWLYKKTDVKALPLVGKWYDIGDMNYYEKAKASFS